MSLDSTTKKIVNSKPDALSLAIKEKGILFTAYIPHARGNSWFISTAKSTI